MGAAAPPPVHDNVRRLIIAHIEPNPWNPNAMDEREFNLAVQFIREQGFIGSIVVRPKPKAKDRYQILDGEHRWRAAQECGLTEIPAVVLEVDDAAARVITYNMNQIRGTNDPRKTAQFFAELRDLLPDTDITAALDLSGPQLDVFIAIGTADFNWDDIPDELIGIGDQPLLAHGTSVVFDRVRFVALETRLIEMELLEVKYQREEVPDAICRALGV